MITKYQFYYYFFLCFIIKTLTARINNVGLENEREIEELSIVNILRKKILNEMKDESLG